MLSFNSGGEKKKETERREGGVGRWKAMVCDHRFVCKSLCVAHCLPKVRRLVEPREAIPQ